MSSEAAQLLEAADFAARKHRGQRRKDPERTPYINHPIGVARILTHEAGVTDIAVLQAALLHDTVEDTDTTLDEVELHFGAQVRHLVEEVTDDKTLPKLERKRLQVEQAPHNSPGAKLVKLADKLYNLRDLNRCTPEGWTEHRVQEYFEWAAQVVKGLQGTNRQLEEALQQLFTERGVDILSGAWNHRVAETPALSGPEWSPTPPFQRLSSSLHGSLGPAAKNICLFSTESGL